MFMDELFILIVLSLQCLVNVLKSLVDWDISRREYEKKSNQSLAEEVNSKESEEKSRDDMPDNFEKAKAHKSTMEAVISEVIYQGFSLTAYYAFI